MTYNICSGVIRWQMPALQSDFNSNVCIVQRLFVKIATWSLTVSRTWAFSLALAGFEIFTFQNSLPWICRSMSCCRTFEVSPFDGKYMTSYLMAIVMFAHHLRYIRKTNKRPKVWPWKLRSRSRRRKTGLALFDYKFSISYMWFFLQNVSYLLRYIHAKGNTHLYTHTQRETGVMTAGKVCKADLPKNCIKSVTD